MARRRARLAPNPHRLELKASMLDELWEAAGIDDIEEWFRAPWNNGRHAVDLCIETRVILGGVNFAVDQQLDALRDLRTVPRSALTSVDYDRVDAIRYEASRSPARDDVFVEAAASILMNLIAASDGGGHVANVHLAGAFWPQLRDGNISEDAARAIVGQHRALDLGLHFSDVDQPSRLFRWLWLNGRYRMAMTIGRPSSLTPTAT